MVVFTSLKAMDDIRHQYVTFDYDNTESIRHKNDKSLFSQTTERESKVMLSTPHALSHWAAENFSQRSKVTLYLPSPYHTLWRTSATFIPHFSCLSSFQFFACLCRTSQERSLQSHSSFFFSPIYTPKKLWPPKQLPDFYQQPPTMDWLNSLANNSLSFSLSAASKAAQLCLQQGHNVPVSFCFL